MIVECPRCSTRYRLDEKRIARENPAFKCSRCGTIFLRFPEEPGTQRTPGPPRRKTQSRQPTGETGILPFLPLDTSHAAVAKEPPEPPVEPEAEAAEQPAALASLSPSPPRPQEDAPDHGEAAAGAEWNDSVAGLLLPQRHSSFRTVCAVMGAIVLTHLLLALYLKSSHRRTESFFGSLPLVGEPLLEERALACKVDLRNVRGSYEIIKDRRQVFTISGEAVNNSAAFMSDIQVEGTIITKDGKISRKVIFCGNEARLTNLSTREIDLLHRLDPSYSLSPGESSRFLIVFTNPPANLREFTTKVISVRPAVAARSRRFRHAAHFSSGKRLLASPKGRENQHLSSWMGDRPGRNLDSLLAARADQG